MTSINTTFGHVPRWAEHVFKVADTGEFYLADHREVVSSGQIDHMFGGFHIPSSPRGRKRSKPSSYLDRVLPELIDVCYKPYAPAILGPEDKQIGNLFKCPAGYPMIPLKPKTEDTIRYLFEIAIADKRVRDTFVSWMGHILAGDKVSWGVNLVGDTAGLPEQLVALMGAGNSTMLDATDADDEDQYLFKGLAVVSDFSDKINEYTRQAMQRILTTSEVGRNSGVSIPLNCNILIPSKHPLRWAGRRWLDVSLGNSDAIVTMFESFSHRAIFAYLRGQKDPKGFDLGRNFLAP